MPCRRAGAPRRPRSRHRAPGRPTASRRAAPPARASRSARDPARARSRTGRPGPPGPLATRSRTAPESWSTDTVTAAPGACWLALDSDSCTIRYAHTPTPDGTWSSAAGTDSSTDTPARRAASTSAGRSASCGCGASPAGWSWRSTPSSRRMSASASRAASLSEPNSARAGSGRLAEAVRRGLGPHRDQRHVMGDHVMQLPRDPGALLQHGPPRPLSLGALGLGGQGALGAQPGTDAVHRDRRGGEDDGGAGRAVQVGMSAASHSHHGMRLSAHIHHSTGRCWRIPARQNAPAARAPAPGPTASRPTRRQVPAGPAAAPAIRPARPASDTGPPAAAAPPPPRPAASCPRLGGSGGPRGERRLARAGCHADDAQRQRRHARAPAYAARRSCGERHRPRQGRVGADQHLDQPVPRTPGHGAGHRSAAGADAGHPFHDPRVGRQGRPLITPACVIPRYQLGPAARPDCLAWYDRGSGSLV